MRSRVISIRVDEETRETLRAAMDRTGATRTGVIVAAIKDFYARSLSKRALRPYEVVKDLVGVVKGPTEPLSVQTGRRFRQKLKQRSRGRP